MATDVFAELDVHVPDGDELNANLADAKPLAYRVGYVRDLLTPLGKVARMKANYERQIADLETSKAGMATELRKYRQMLGDLPPGERAAAEARYTMLGQIKQARGRLAQFDEQVRVAVDAAVREMRRALEPPK